MRWLKASSLAVLLASPAAGFEYVPKWTLVDFPGGQKKACYEFEAAKALASLDADLQECARLRVHVGELVTGAERQSAAFLETIHLLEQKNLALEGQRDALLRTLRVSERDRIKAENNPTGAIGWVVAAGVGLIAVGLGVVVGVQAAPKP